MPRARPFRGGGDRPCQPLPPRPEQAREWSGSFMAPLLLLEWRVAKSTSPGLAPSLHIRGRLLQAAVRDGGEMGPQYGELGCPLQEKTSLASGTPLKGQEY